MWIQGDQTIDYKKGSNVSKPAHSAFISKIGRVKSSLISAREFSGTGDGTRLGERNPKL